MKIKVRFFAHFRDLFADREREIEIEAGATAARLFGILCDTQERKSGLFEDDKLKPHIVVMINGKNLASRSGLETPLADGDVVAIFPLMGGG